jgi:uncharacterized protein YbjT (DUF2867 family)
MNIAILGATGGTRMNLVQQALNAGHRVRALAHTPEKLRALRSPGSAALRPARQSAAAIRRSPRALWRLR